MDAIREDARMWEADALLDAIFDNPDDDTPRLVYADWLQEHDQEAYAHFIRLHCRMARVPHEEKRVLVEELHPVWLAFRDTMSHTLLKRFGGIGSFERGMPSTVRLTPREFLEEPRSWWPVPPPTSIALVYNLDDPPIGEVPHLRCVQSLAAGQESSSVLWGGELERYGPFLDDSVVWDLVSSPHLTNLRTLHVSGVYGRERTVTQLLIAPLLRNLLDISIHFELRNRTVAHLWFRGNTPETVQKAIKVFVERRRGRFLR